MIDETQNIEKSVKEFLNPQERFAARMKASFQKTGDSPSHAAIQQKNLFVEDAEIEVSPNGDKPLYDRKLLSF